MVATNLSSLSAAEFDLLKQEVDQHSGLNQVLAWAATKSKDQVHPHYVSEVVTQDEFTHDVIVPYLNYFLVYDTT